MGLAVGHHSHWRRQSQVGMGGVLMHVKTGVEFTSKCKSATEDLIARDLRIPGHEAILIDEACREAVAQLEPEDCKMVMVAQKSQARKARGHSTDMGATALAHKALARDDTLRLALHQKLPSRKPKPRSSGVINEELWNGATTTAIERLMKKHCIDDLDMYYTSMCDLGKSLLVTEIHGEAQELYDYRAQQLHYRASRRAKQ